MAKKEDTYDLIQKHLYDDKHTALQHLSPQQYEIKQRLMLSINMILDNPLTQDKSIVDYLVNGCGGTCAKVSSSQAYRDLSAIKKIIGNIQLHSKNWYRYLIVEGAKEAFDIAKIEKDAKGMAAALDKIGKYTRADKEDDEFDFSELLPPVFEPSDDVTLLENMQPIDNLEDKRKEFRAIFKEKLNKTAVDVEYDESEPIG